MPTKQGLYPDLPPSDAEFYGAVRGHTNSRSWETSPSRGTVPSEIRVELQDHRAAAPQRPSSTRSARPSLPKRRPYFCVCAIVACCSIMVIEIRENNWEFQPLFCSEADCQEANPMLGPTARVMQHLGAKDDHAIFDDHEWWRIFTCNWLHAGIFHLLMNMVAILNLGFGLEKTFGTLKIGVLYIVAGLFGASVSVVFLPGVLSVGASASVFGLVGACWADIIVNFCARGTLRGSGVVVLFLATAVNVVIGLTPYVDNFMHLGGMVAGLLIGLLIFSEKSEDARGNKRYSVMQKVIAVAAFLIIVCAAVAVYIIVGTNKGSLDVFRNCTFCQHINCVEISWFTNHPWYSCDIANVRDGCFSSGGTCTLSLNSTTLIADCQLSARTFTHYCNRDSPNCAFENTQAGRDAMCSQLCTTC
ncbi:hypothetical protein AB1Y20_008445 [Prymnesium parvum]|uniref:rhomboid protease n=1 Tax=Prymnesium parvum TaxID=97485 RepID=A0AB34IRA5_PRYPA